MKKNLSLLAAGTLTLGASMAHADALADITSASTTALAIVAAGGAAYLGIKLAAVGYNIGGRWISKLGRG